MSTDLPSGYTRRGALAELPAPLTPRQVRALLWLREVPPFQHREAPLDRDIQAGLNSLAHFHPGSLVVPDARGTGLRRRYRFTEYGAALGRLAARMGDVPRASFDTFLTFKHDGIGELWHTDRDVRVAGATYKPFGTRWLLVLRIAATGEPHGPMFRTFPSTSGGHRFNAKMNDGTSAIASLTNSGICPCVRDRQADAIYNAEELEIRRGLGKL